METLLQWIIEHAEHAHWFIFFGILLAGFNIPISADLVIIISAVLAATIIPENTPLLFGSVFLGCTFSAHIAYWLGRLLGPQLLRLRLFSKMLAPTRLEKIQQFYNRYGLLTLLIGRFIPFGVRNAIFMTTGMTRVHFGRFVWRDTLACLVWTASSFSIFYLLGHNYQKLKALLQTFNVLIFAAFSVTVIVVVWYKRRKKSLPD